MSNIAVRTWNGLDGLINDKPFMPWASPEQQAEVLMELAEQDGERLGGGERRLILEYARAVRDYHKVRDLVDDDGRLYRVGSRDRLRGSACGGCVKVKKGDGILERLTGRKQNSRKSYVFLRSHHSHENFTFTAATDNRLGFVFSMK